MISITPLVIMLVVLWGQSQAELVEPCNQGDQNATELDLMCRPGNSTAPLCSGRGVCVCGQCQCNDPTIINQQYRVYGRHCECDNFSCGRANGKICSGHGICECNQQCKCHEGWTGRDCSCPTSTATCKASNGKTCNGTGHCVCGVCNCFDGKYTGRTCEYCPTCPTPCIRLRDCVLHRIFATHPMNQSAFETECHHNYVLIKRMPYVHENRLPAHVCQFVDPADDCTYYFNIDVTDRGNITLIIEEDKECPPPVMPVLTISLNKNP